MVELKELDELPIRVTARGEWLHGDRPLHPRVAALFQKSVAYDGSAYLLRLQRWTSPLVVDDTAYFVRTLRGLELQLSDGVTEPLDASTLMQSADNVLYCRVQRAGWALPCRFTAQQYHELALALANDAGAFVIDGRAWPLAPYDRRPLLR
jgi:hypothetical protein